MNESVVSWLNALSSDAASREFHKCCGAKLWCDQMTQARPFADSEALKDKADRVFDSMHRKAWLEAFAGHPKIGDLESMRMRLAGNKEWSAGEQAGVETSDEQTLNRLAEGNVAYEQRFGYVFILCATGLAAAEMLAQLDKRLQNDDATELRVASAEQRKITYLRLKKLKPHR